MKPLRYYVDTSVWSFLLEENRPEHREATEEFFRQFKEGGLIAISEVVLREVARAPGTRRDALTQLIQRYTPTVLAVTPETQALAERYVAEHVIPPRYMDDALHLAIAVIHGFEVLVSWNFEHLVRLKTRQAANGLNRLLGYDEIEIVSPEEVISR